MTESKLLFMPDRPAGMRYSPRERAWHWIQTLLLLSLPITGFAIHFPERSASFMGFSAAVAWHSRFGALLWANVILGLLYFAAAGRWPKLLPAPGDFTGGSLRLMRYYLRGIPNGDPHPFEVGGSSRLAPVAKFHYAALLLVLAPFQMVTGALIWFGNRLIIAPEGFLGLPILGPAHTLGAYLFVAFLLLHIYLTTSGPGAVGRVRSMLTGRTQPPSR